MRIAGMIERYRWRSSSMEANPKIWGCENKYSTLSYHGDFGGGQPIYKQINIVFLFPSLSATYEYDMMCIIRCHQSLTTRSEIKLEIRVVHTNK